MGTATTGGAMVYAVDVSIDGGAPPLEPGMTVDLSIVTAQVQRAIVVPNPAVQQTASGSVVWTVSSRDQIVASPVQTGLRDGTNTQISAGLQVGQRIVVPLSSIPPTPGLARNAGGGGNNGATDVPDAISVTGGR
jgi:hypothetical protein